MEGYRFEFTAYRGDPDRHPAAAARRRRPVRPAWAAGVLSLLCAGLFAGCDGDSVDPPHFTPPDAGTAAPALQVRGVVRDAATGGVLSGAALTLEPSGRSTASVAGGVFLLDAPAPGSYQLVAALSGYETRRGEPFVVAADEPTAEQTLWLQPAPAGRATLGGTVVRADGSPAAGVRVTLPPGRREATSSADGRFLFTALYPGSYRLVASADDAGQLDARREQLQLAADQRIEVRLVLADRPPAGTAYTGSAACAECHAPAHARWLGSAHARALGDAGTLTDEGRRLLLGPTTAVELGAGRLAVLRRAEDGTLSVELSAAEGEAATHRVTGWVGAGAQGQAPLTEVDGELQALPLAWARLAGGWVARDAAGWFDEGGSAARPGPGASFAGNCVACHASGLTLVEADGVPSSRPAAGAAGDDPRWGEAGVACERCHGPGQAHADWHRAQPAGTPSRYILDPADLDPERRLGLCAQCHTRGTATVGVAGRPLPFPHGADGLPQPWDDLAGRFEEAPLDWPGLATSRGNHQQATDLRRSAHGNGPGYRLSCVDCHDPHGQRRPDAPAQLVEPADDNTLCRRCHGPDLYAGPELPGVHSGHRTHDPLASGSGRCVGCHMARTATNLAWSPTDWGGELASHALRVLPPRASLPGPGAAPGAQPPSGCLTCHLAQDARLRAGGSWCACPTGTPASPQTLQRLQTSFDLMFPAAGAGTEVQP